MMSHYFSISLLCFVYTTAAARTPSIPPKPSPMIPGLYVFGDSLVDNGNNNQRSVVARANYLPYGVDFPEGATGRFSNGRTIADWTAEKVGLPYPPAYMSKIRPNSSWLTGINYASSACGILEESGSHLNCFGLNEQIGFFNKTMDEALKQNLTTPQDLRIHLSNSVALFVTGSNDYVNNYFGPTYHGSKKYTPQEFANLLLSNVSMQLERLHALGVRKVMFSEIAPVGCLTHEFRRLGHCNETKNDIVSLFNKGLGTLLNKLQSKLPKSHFVAAKTYKLTHNVVLNPAKYGFTNCAEPCCEAMANGFYKCQPFSKPCEDRNKYCFWDPFHPTEAMSSFVVSHCFKDPSICNIKELLKS